MGFGSLFCLIGWFGLHVFVLLCLVGWLVGWVGGIVCSFVFVGDGGGGGCACLLLLLLLMLFAGGGVKGAFKAHCIWCNIL